MFFKLGLFKCPEHAFTMELRFLATIVNEAASANVIANVKIKQKKQLETL